MGRIGVGNGRAGRSLGLEVREGWLPGKAEVASSVQNHSVQ